LPRAAPLVAAGSSSGQGHLDVDHSLEAVLSGLPSVL
jgi:hypothetical protein